MRNAYHRRGVLIFLLAIYASIDTMLRHGLGKVQGARPLQAGRVRTLFLGASSTRHVQRPHPHPYTHRTSSKSIAWTRAAAALGGMSLLTSVTGTAGGGSGGPTAPTKGMTSMAAGGGGGGGGNALLEQEGLPKFGKITPEAVVPAIRQLSEDFLSRFQELEARCSQEGAASFEAVIETMEKARGPLEYGWGVVNHLLGVKNSDALREAHQTVQPEVVAMLTQIGQSRPLYDAMVAIQETPSEWEKLDPAQKRIVASSIRDMRLSGVGLDGEAKERFKAIKLELSKLSTSFSNNVLDSTKAFSLLITDKAEVRGLPSMFLDLFAQNAVQKGHSEATGEKGPWAIGLDMPSYLPAMQFLEDRKVRETLYRGFLQRASQAPYDNTENVNQILTLKKELAHLLGYNNYAEVSLASKMAPSIEAVQELTSFLRDKSYPSAVAELQSVQEYANKNGFEGTLALWDLTFWAERMKEGKYGIKEEELRPYFALPNVLDGLFSLSRRIFGIEIVAADGEVEVWDPAVRFYKVLDAESQEHIASFYLDPYSRPENKRGGAWMDVCTGKSRVLGRKPVAYLTCNGSPPVGDTPSLMTFREVETLFHEFGHGAQHMLTEVAHGDAAGINGVEWDAVELPSQFMENWCYDKPTFYGLARHYQTGEPLPEDIFAKLVALKHYNAGMTMLRQLYFGKMDMELHSTFDPNNKDGETIFDVQRRVAREYTVIPPLEEDRFLLSFSHIFAGGYASGYYSYKWAEVMSADAFSAFEEVGLDNEEKVQEVGRRFRQTVLAMGGGTPPSEVYEAFRGRQPKPDALLRHSGLAKEGECASTH
uniref:oligopeptidase A n=1 Tax=Nannochloropsis gaditana (strain CCMP526) TaxID=1093141 RepID=I2CQQ3_NANGC